MRSNNVFDITVNKKADQQVSKDILVRAEWFCIATGLLHFIFGFISIEYIHLFDKEISLASNVLPRLFFVSIPLWLMAILIRYSRISDTLKFKILGVGYFLTYMIACFVHIWIMMWNGNKEIFFYVHASNAFMFTIFFLTIAPPTSVLIFSLASCIVFNVIPIGFLLYKLNDLLMLRWFINDMALSLALSSILAHNIYLLRRKLARIDVYNQTRTKAYLGENVANAIYNRKESELTGKKVSGFIVAMDLRGYTAFKKAVDDHLYHEFMNAYHAMVSQVCGKFGGYIHKTSGDGHLMSFGVMNSGPDLSDIPGIEGDVEKANKRRLDHEFESVAKAVNEIQNAFFDLKHKFLVSENLRIGAGVALGEVNIVQRGHESFRLEFDIDGEVIMRAVRLEEYTKVLSKRISMELGYCVFSEELGSRLHIMSHIHQWPTIDPDLRVRDFVQIEKVFYKSFSKEFVEKYLRAS